MVKLTDAQIADVRLMWSRGYSLGEIARSIGCSVYALSPWIYTDDMARHDDERDRRASGMNPKGEA